MNRVDSQGKELAYTVSRTINTFSDREVIKDFINEFSTEHRTLQQVFTRMCLEWLYKLSTYKDYDYDLRNHDSVKIAKQIDQLIDLKYSKELRFI